MAIYYIVGVCLFSGQAETFPTATLHVLTFNFFAILCNSQLEFQLFHSTLCKIAQPVCFHLLEKFNDSESNPRLS